MFENILKKLHIKTKPDRVVTYFFYGVTFFILLICLGRLITYIFGDARIVNNISPYMYSIWFIFPVLGFSYYVNSGLAKNDKTKIIWYITTCCMLGLMVTTMFTTWVNSGVWWILEQIPNYEIVLKRYPELFAPALKTLSFAFPFIAFFRLSDYFLHMFSFKDEFLDKAVAGFNGLSTSAKAKDTGVFNCNTVICKQKGTNLPVVVPEKKRYEATLVQGATGTGKTATVLLPMSALDLEKKYFFREYSKKLGYSLLKKGIAYISGPFDNEYINQNFNMSFIKPKRGLEEQFLLQVRNLIQYSDSVTGEIVYKNLGITVIENDGKYISDFTQVAKNFGIEVLSVDPGNVNDTLSINPFALPDPPKVASVIADVLKSMYESEGGGGPSDPFFTQVTMDAFQNLAILLKEMYPILNNGSLASLEDMLELLYNFDKVEEMVEDMKKYPELEQKYKLLISYFERNFYKPALNINGYEIPGTRGSGRKDTERFLYGAITQLNNLLRHPGLKKALCGKANILEFDKALSDGAIITACSRKGELGITQSKAFGMFFILQFQDAVLRRSGNEDSRIPHFLYIDEFPEYINKDMEVMFTLFRKYRCAVTIALQNLSQLEKSGKAYYRQTVLANTKTQIVFGDTVPEDSEYWEKAFGKEKVPDFSSSSIKPGNFSSALSGEKEDTSSVTLNIKEKEKMKAYKIAEQGFCSVYYKTKSASGSAVFGKGKTSFLDDKYKQSHIVSQFNFEKYMMSKPDTPTIAMNDSDDTDNDDLLFGTNTTTRLMKELQEKETNSFVKDERFANINTYDSTPLDDNFEIVFDNLEPTLENSKIDGGAITESYETPGVIKKIKI